MNARLDPVIERFRFAHHNLAIMFAMGMTVSEVSRRTGFTNRRLMILLDDPTFSELIAHYQNQHMENMQRVLPTALEDMEYLRVASVRKLMDLFEESDETGEQIPPNVLLKVHSEMADRTGYSKHSTKSVSIDVSFANQLDRAIERSGKTEFMKVIESKALPAELANPAQQRAAEQMPRSRTFRRV